MSLVKAMRRTMTRAKPLKHFFGPGNPLLSASRTISSSDLERMDDRDLIVLGAVENGIGCLPMQFHASWETSPEKLYAKLTQVSHNLGNLHLHDLHLLHTIFHEKRDFEASLRILQAAKQKVRGEKIPAVEGIFLLEILRSEFLGRLFVLGDSIAHEISYSDFQAFFEANKSWMNKKDQANALDVYSRLEIPEVDPWLEKQILELLAQPGFIDASVYFLIFGPVMVHCRLSRIQASEDSIKKEIPLLPVFQAFNEIKDDRLGLDNRISGEIFVDDRKVWYAGRQFKLEEDNIGRAIVQACFEYIHSCHVFSKIFLRVITAFYETNCLLRNYELESLERMMIFQRNLRKKIPQNLKSNMPHLGFTGVLFAQTIHRRVGWNFWLQDDHSEQKKLFVENWILEELEEIKRDGLLVQQLEWLEQLLIEDTSELPDLREFALSKIIPELRKVKSPLLI